MARRETQLTRLTAVAGYGVAFIEAQNEVKLRYFESYLALVVGAITLNRQ